MTLTAPRPAERTTVAAMAERLRALDWSAAGYRLITAPHVALAPRQMLWGWSGLTLEGLAYTLVGDRAAAPQSHVGLRRLIVPLDQSAVWLDATAMDGEVTVTRRTVTRPADGRHTLGAVPPVRLRLSNAATYIIHARPILLPEEL